jgi:hypothetical protein
MKLISRQLADSWLVFYSSINGLVAASLIAALLTGCEQWQSTTFKQSPKTRPLARLSSLPEIQSSPSYFRIQISEAVLTRRNSHSLQVEVRYVFEVGKPTTGRKYRFFLDFPGTTYSGTFDLDADDLHATETTIVVGDPSRTSSEKLKPPADYKLTILEGEQSEGETQFKTCSNMVIGQFAASIYD